MQEYTIKAFEQQPYSTDAYIYSASDYEISRDEVKALLEAQDILEAMWYSEVPVIVGLGTAAPEEGFRVYDSTYLLYTKGWHGIDGVNAYLVNQQMREMCRSEKSTSLIFDAVSEDLVELFNNTVFVVGMTHVQTPKTIKTVVHGHEGALTKRATAHHPNYG